MRACPSCGEGVPERARFCAWCGTALDDGGERGDELRKVVTVLFCDLTGSTSLGERLDSESLRRVLNRYFATMEAILERHGGKVEKFIGDAIVAVTGIPAVREDDALRLVRAAVEMRAALAELNEELEARWDVRLQVRTGINTGEVVATPGRSHGFVTGDAINVAARLEQAAEPGGILIGETTYRLVRDAVQATEVELELKGKAERVRAYALQAVDIRAAGVRRRLDQPIVGREEEIDRLRAALDAVAAERRCTLVPVLGPAGMGKSRLATEFLAVAAAQATVLRGRCLPTGEGSTFWPVGEVIKEAAGIGEEDSPATVREKIAGLELDDDDREAIAQRLTGVLGLGEAASQPEEIFWAVRKLLEALSRERPLVVLFDDVHWGEATFLDGLEHLAASSFAAPVLVVAAARTELLELRPALGEGERVISLRPLTRPQVAVLLANLVGGLELDDDVIDRVFDVADGTPLAAEELLRLLVDDGHIARDGGRWSAVRDLATVPTPPSIHALIASRLDRLPQAERAVLERASVVGKVFWPDAVRELSPPEAQADIDRNLDALMRKELVVADEARLGGGSAVAFSHMLVRDVAYQGMLKAVRADLHVRCAAWIERAAGERVAEYDEILGHNLETAHRYLTEVEPAQVREGDLAARAAEHLGSAGTRALARCDMPAAVNLLERASSLLEADASTRRDLEVKLSVALAGTGQVSRVDRILSERIEAERTGRSYLVCHEPGGGQRTFMLADTTDVVSIGRKPDNDVALVWDNQVSRRHAALRRSGDGWTLVDDGTSRNGSYLNGRQVAGPEPLRDGDVLRFGDTVALYRAPTRGKAPAGAVPAEPDGATIFGVTPLAPAELSDTERLVLSELRRTWASAREESALLTDDELARRTSMRPEAVKEAIASLELKFSVEGLSEDQRRERLAMRAARGR